MLRRMGRPRTSTPPPHHPLVIHCVLDCQSHLPIKIARASDKWSSSCPSFSHTRSEVTSSEKQQQAARQALARDWVDMAMECHEESHELVMMVVSSKSKGRSRPTLATKADTLESKMPVWRGVVLESGTYVRQWLEALH